MSGNARGWQTRIVAENVSFAREDETETLDGFFFCARDFTGNIHAVYSHRLITGWHRLSSTIVFRPIWKAEFTWKLRADRGNESGRNPVGTACPKEGEVKVKGWEGGKGERTRSTAIGRSVLFVPTGRTLVGTMRWISPPFYRQRWDRVPRKYVWTFKAISSRRTVLVTCKKF